MTTKLVKCASNHREIIKLGLSDGRRVKFLASMLGVVHDSLRYEWHLGNVGYNQRWRHSSIRCRSPAQAMRDMTIAQAAYVKNNLVRILGSTSGSGPRSGRSLSRARGGTALRAEC